MLLCQYALTLMLFDNIIITGSYSTFLAQYEILLKVLYSVLLPLVVGFIINLALMVHLLNSLGSILARRHCRGAHMPCQVTNNIRILPVTIYTPGWRAAMWIKCLAEGQKCGALIDWNQTYNPLIIQSHRFNPIYHCTSTNFCTSLLRLHEYSVTLVKFSIVFSGRGQEMQMPYHEAFRLVI